MKQKTLFIVFKGLSFAEKLKICWKIGDTSFKWKGYNNYFDSSIAKKRHCIKSTNTFINQIEVLEETLMSNLICNIEVDNATKSNLKNATGIDTSYFALKSNLATLKTEIDKIDFDKFKTVPADLNKLRNVVKNEVVKKLCMRD